MRSAFLIERLVKEYPEFTLGPLDISLEPGTVLGFIGPNGAGKTTTINCLAGLVQPDEGAVLINGRALSHHDSVWKEPIGFVGEERPFFERWPGARNLTFLSRFYSAWDEGRVRELADRLDLDLQKPVSDLSKGNRVKLALIAAMAHAPRLLLFDEPTDGLDPVVRTEALDLIREFMEKEERAVFYATHILSDVCRLADELAFIHQGRVFLRERTDRLTDLWCQILFKYSGDCPPLEAVTDHRYEGQEHRVITSDGERTLAQLRDMGAVDIHTSHLGVDEISVAILKNVARSGEE